MSRKRRRRYYRREYTKPLQGGTPFNLDVALKMGGAVFALVLVVVSGIAGIARRMFKSHPGPDQSLKSSPSRSPRRQAREPVLPPSEARGQIHQVSRRPFGIESPMPYRSASCLLSKGERAFWYPLYRAVKGKYRVFPKVRLADVVTVEKVWGRQRWFKKIGHFHIDFVVCDPRTTTPLLVVELDDRSHRRLGRKDKDQFKDKVLAAAGLPIYRVKCQQAYDVAEISENIRRLLAASAK